MTENIPQTSASDRYEAARKALGVLAVTIERAGEVTAQIEESRSADGMEEVFAARDAADDLLDHLIRHGERQLDALRALITPPGVGETDEQIAARVMRSVPFRTTLIGDHVCLAEGMLTDLAVASVRAGIQDAHETWEPADHPSQEMMLRWLGLDYKESTDDEGEPSIYIHPQHIEREEI